MIDYIWHRAWETEQSVSAAVHYKIGGHNMIAGKAFSI